MKTKTKKKLDKALHLLSSIDLDNINRHTLTETEKLIDEAQTLIEETLASANGFFPVTHICREDLAEKFDTSDISDDVMEDLASKMSDDYLTQLYWESMEIIAEDYFKIPRKQVK